MTQEQRRGRAARHVEEVLPAEYVLSIFGFANPGSLRKLMSRNGVRMVSGYRYSDVKRVFENWDPERAWPRPHPKHDDEPEFDERPAGRAKDRRSR